MPQPPDDFPESWIHSIGVSRTSRYVNFAGIIMRVFLLYINMEGYPLYIKKIEEGGDGYE